MANWKSRSDDQIWWESQPGNRGKTYPGDDLASKQYERNKAAGENNLSAAKSFWSRLTSPKKVDLGPSKKDESEYTTNESGAVSLNAKGGKISLKNCRVTTHAKNKKQSNW